MLSVNVDTTEGVSVYSVDYDISNDTKRDILKALETIRQNPLIKACEIDGASVWGTVKQFDSTIDDEQRNEIPRGDTFEFRSDVQRIKIYPSGEVYLIAQNKWNSSETLTFEIE
ncbi:hypothetical protein AUJ10_03795 [Candidatus Pacearchaeota archaeon CG1_02_31_27]|nr:MAG: hypothetical protein AUJ10_03795 [Candidatus Pacearchaeota archaeon CG1_02_31_27]